MQVDEIGGGVHPAGLPSGFGVEFEREDRMPGRADAGTPAVAEGGGVSEARFYESSAPVVRPRAGLAYWPDQEWRPAMPAAPVGLWARIRAWFNTICH